MPPRKLPSTKAVSARVAVSLINDLTALLADTGITMTHVFDTAMKDFLRGHRAAAIRKMKEANQ